MKKFLKHLLFFLLPFTTVFPLEYMIRQVPNPYKYKYEWMQMNAENIEILIFGSSHTFYGLRPNYFSRKAFNLANVSQENEQDFFLLKYWADRYKHLKTVIIPISSYTWFSKGLEHGSESFRCRYYKIYMDCNMYPNLSVYNFELSDFNIAKKKISQIFYPKENPGYDQYGWGNEFKLSQKDKKTWEDGTEAKAAIQRHSVKSWDQIEVNYERMKEIAIFCKKHNIQLILVTTPCWHKYYEKLNKKQLDKMYELTYQFQKEFDIPYFDYLRDQRFCANDFYDSNHLSDIGAIKFTKILNDDINRIKN